MKKALPLILMALSCGLAFAQQKTVTLQVTLGFPKNDTSTATVSLLLAADSLIVISKIAGARPVSFSVNPFTKYLIRVTGVTIEDVEKTAGITDKSTSVFIPLKRKTRVLKEVVVTARKPIIRQEDDKTIIEAEALAASSSNAFEVIEKTPGAVVDQDGNVYLNSMTPAVIQINGREVKLGAADLASLLKSLPAGSVSKIEVLRNPSARYDAASSGGILNIVLKKGIKLGSSGSVNTGYFQGVYHTKFLGYSLNRSNDKLSSYFSQNIMNRHNFEELKSSRIIGLDNTTLSQSAFTKYPSLNFYTGGGLDYTINQKWSVGYDLRLSLNKNESEAQNLNLIQSNSSSTALSKSRTDIDNSFRSMFWSNSFSAKYKMDSVGSEWTFQADYNYFRNRNNQDYQNLFELPQAPTWFGDGRTNAVKHNGLFQSDFTKKFKNKFTVEAGVKSTLSNSRNSAFYYLQKGNNRRETDSFQTNTFRYREWISATYLQVSKTIAGFTIKPGLRMENTRISGNQIIPSDTSLSINRTDFFPYVYIRHRLFKIMGFQLMGNLIFRRSIARPYYEILNPYPRFIDPFLFETGNPRLTPQFTTNYEFNVMADDFPVFSAGINQTRDMFSNVTYQDDQTKIAYRTYDNLGKNREYYLRLVGGIPPGGKFFFYAGTQHNFNEYNGVYQNQPLKYKRGSWTFFTYQELRPSKNWRFSMHGFMRTRGLQNLYELGNFGALNVNLTRLFANQKLSITLSGNDIFRTNKIDFALQQANVNAFGSRLNDTRRIGLNLRYNFGIKPKEEKKNNFEQPAESN